MGKEEKNITIKKIKGFYYLFFLPNSFFLLLLQNTFLLIMFCFIAKLSIVKISLVFLYFFFIIFIVYTRFFKVYETNASLEENVKFIQKVGGILSSAQPYEGMKLLTLQYNVNMIEKNDVLILCGKGKILINQNTNRLYLYLPLFKNINIQELEKKLQTIET